MRSSRRKTALLQHVAAIVAVSALLLQPAAQAQPSSQLPAVQTGLDVLEAHNFAELKPSLSHPRRIALVTNQTGVDAHGRRTIDILAKVPGLQLQAIFSPEHGVAGVLDQEQIADSRDRATAVPIFSLYGSTEAQRRPSSAALKNLDAIVFDIQDSGVRFYTYKTTLGYCLEAAAQAGIELIVLDRPNPINGTSVQGPISDAVISGATPSFVNYHPLPVRHGMTLGELARMFNAERGIHAQLTVIPMQGWLRTDWFDSTGIPWLPPSPNLRTLTEATLYPGVGIIESANVSVGRGTGTPFELVGAPWINARQAAQLAAYVNNRKIPGVRFLPASFTPTDNKFGRQLCYGIRIILLHREALDSPELGLELASSLHKLHPQEFQLSLIENLLANADAYRALESGQDPRRIAANRHHTLAAFQQLRQKYLLYH